MEKKTSKGKNIFESLDKKECDMYIGNQVKIAREWKNLNQGSLAEIIGVGQNQVSRLESGKNGIDFIKVCMIAHICNTDLNEFNPIPALTKTIENVTESEDFLKYKIQFLERQLVKIQKQLAESKEQQNVILSKELSWGI